MRLKFTKMQGVGNDFVVIDGVSRDIEITPQLAKRVADRHCGVGCDQVLLVEKPRRGDADFRYRIWNADGGEVEQCGNGARCFVRFVHDKGLTKKNEIRVETLSGVIVPRLEADGQVSVDIDRKSTRLNSSHGYISYAVFCLKKKKSYDTRSTATTMS